MIPSSSTSSTQLTFRTTVSENIEDAVSGELMTRAVTLFPCGHTFNEDTVIQCLARNKLCPLDRRLIERHAPNYTVRHLAETAEAHPLEELKHEPSEEAVGHFLRGKELAEKGEYTTAIEALLQALQLTPTYEKAQAYLEFCLKRSSKASLSSQQLPPLFTESRDKGKEKSLSSINSPKEDYTELLFNLLEEPSIQENSILKKILENQVEELMSQEGEELNEKEKISYKWTEKLLGENKKVRQFVVEKLRQIHQQSSCLASVAPQPSISTSSTTPISMVSLYKAIVQVHFPEGSGDSIAQAGILDRIYGIKPTLSAEEKVPYIFQKLFTLAASLSPTEFKENSKESKVLTLSNYSSYLLNINRLLLWQNLPGGTDYLNQPKIKALPLKKKGELLKQWIEKHGKNIIKLNLDEVEVGLTFLPPEIWQLSRLSCLSISNDQLTTLPPEIGQLSHLQTLDLCCNQLTTLPGELWQLFELRELYLTLNLNQLAAIPVEIGQLSRLQKLDLRYHQIANISAEISQLSRLQKLDLSFNNLTAIPAAIGQLSKLQRLCLGSNQLTAIPPEIGQLSELNWLDLSSNQLTAIPAAIGQLSKLQRLELGCNQLTVIPAEVGQLFQLQMLSLHNNQLTAIPAEIGQLSQLDWLDLIRNQLAVVPHLPKVRMLNIESNLI
ncbi:Uncharacterized protein NEOC65_000329 [Neochlamydia sp. AcF65]|uniref:leucine-rich repeat domain-containing protein n=1 Tax=Neochlamydia sp. AcF65 TaxID=2795735 RepID=UPI001BC9B328|nr:leucine-rich repeat domain-containing protein [Neochlamydia sp. AcF65]MBS4165276.1 Uncharacterized protein [Neochlamydia sp. AcF65]